MQNLVGLPPSFAKMVNQKLSSDPLQTLEDTPRHIQRLPSISATSSVRSDVPDASALAVGSGSHGCGCGRGHAIGGAGCGHGSSTSGSRYCNFCIQTNHTEDEYCTKYGTPAWSNQMATTDTLLFL